MTDPLDLEAILNELREHVAECDEFGHDGIEFPLSAREARAITSEIERLRGEAESLTGASGEQTTETGTEGPSNPEGLAEGWSYEYRAVSPDSGPMAWQTKNMWRGGLRMGWFVERRLVGPVERVTEETEAE